MSEIKYVSPSTLTHYDEKIKDIIDDKVDKIDGKGLSANDLTNELKTEYDDTVAKAHEHSNIDVLKKFSEDSNGMPLYDNDKFYDGLVANDLTTTDEGYALDARQGKVLGDRVSELETPTFTQATTRANIASGESTKTILGKIKKYFADLKSHAFNAPANNLTTTAEGYALDARQGKTLQDKIGSTDISTIGDGTVTNAISTINSNLENTYIKPESIVLLGVDGILSTTKTNYDTYNNRKISDYDFIIFAAYAVNYAGTPLDFRKTLLLPSAFCTTGQKVHLDIMSNEGQTFSQIVFEIVSDTCISMYKVSGAINCATVFGFKLYSKS